MVTESHLSTEILSVLNKHSKGLPMKVAIRAFALALVAMGAAASTHIARADQAGISAKASFMPVPTCPPDGTTDCGMCQIARNCVR